MIEITATQDVLELKSDSSVEAFEVSMFICPTCPVRGNCTKMDMLTNKATIKDMGLEEAKKKADCNPISP